MSKTTYKPKHATLAQRKTKCYELVKAMAESEGIPLPNAGNSGAEFDNWLQNKLAAVEAAKDKHNVS